jgi:hypothetical protein
MCYRKSQVFAFTTLLFFRLFFSILLFCIGTNYKRTILCAFAKLRKWLLASSCLSVCPHKTTRLPLDIFSLNFSIFWKSVEEIQISIKSDKNSVYFTQRPLYSFDHISLYYFLEGEMFKTKAESKNVFDPWHPEVLPVNAESKNK